MSASQFVGRVGSLAVALGIGVGVFAGAGVAVAERGGANGDSGSTSADSATASSVSGTRRGAAAAVDAPDAPSGEPGAVAVEPQAEPEPLIHIDPVFEEPPAGELTEVFDEATEPATGGPDPIPVALEGPEAVAYADPGPVEEVTPQPKTAVLPVTTAASAPAAKADSGPLTFAPVTAYYDGILQGNLNVTSASGCGTGSSECKLTYSLVDSSNGGKANFGNVPKALDPLLPVGAKGGAGSFTFLPYATWIDPAKPTSFPTPTGTQTFTVRVSENTKFNQTITSIPLIGALAAPIISLLQQLPLISSLLVPLIGASATTTVSVNVGGLTGGKQVAYTYVVDSFDGTPISMNYFPAAAPSLLPNLGNKQATIFNGPGLGGA
ncbi:MAG: hypothetical protein FGM52_11680, partial [Mycobacterium sp.]|nr:hypothetical protein [Mycobacterium sp.]